MDISFDLLNTKMVGSMYGRRTAYNVIHQEDIRMHQQQLIYLNDDDKMIRFASRSAPQRETSPINLTLLPSSGESS